MTQSSQASPPPQSPALDITLGDLARGFFKIGMLGFGGVGPIARHVIVGERKWMSEREFAAVLGLGQILPGGNVLNASVMIGDRACGWRGAATALLSLMAMPLVIVAILGLVYTHFAALPQVGAAVSGSAAAAAGMVMGTAMKMAWRVKPNAVAAGFGIVAFLALGIVHVPLALAALVLIPLSIAATILRHRHAR